jgi:hypothetical protein
MSALVPVQIVQGHQELSVGQDHQVRVGHRWAVVGPLARRDRGCVDNLGVPRIQRRLLHDGPVNALVTFCDGDAIVANVGPAGRGDARTAKATRRSTIVARQTRNQWTATSTDSGEGRAIEIANKRSTYCPPDVL